ncbi:hypothetical protein [Nonomuraea deserti]|uniref:hypothetical protein n=1 Tax=Nonomuraea deserti TaxID=1848322 RepID=UPI0014054C8B|nr:hypothetical protein [Nonomuraea deserti]
MLAVVLIGGAAGGWLLLQQFGDGPGPPTDYSGKRPRLVRTPSATPAAEVVKLRPITGAQLCDAISDAFRKDLVTDGKYGGKDASTGAATETDKQASCEWRNNKMDVGAGVIGHRSLSISVRARSTESQNALEYAKDQFEQDRKTHERRVNVRDGQRIDGRSSGSAFGETTKLAYGDASYSQSSIGHSGLSAEVYVREGPWLIKVKYGGSNRTGRKYPSGDEVRAAAGKVAERVTAEMAKDASKVDASGPCAILSTEDVEEAFFPTVTGPSVGENDGRIKQTTCAWKIVEAVKHEPGQEYTSRGGELHIHVVDWQDGGGSGSGFQFDRDARKYDRYRAKGGIGDTVSHTTYGPREELSGLGEKAFAVVSTTTKPGEEDAEPRQEILVEVLTGERTVEFTFRGTTAGGGIVEADGYQEPVFESDAARSAVTRLARTFLAGLK